MYLYGGGFLLFSWASLASLSISISLKRASASLRAAQINTGEPFHKCTDNTFQKAHVTPLFISLHWLPVAARIKFKTLMLAYRTTTGSAPPYFHSLRVNPNSLSYPFPLVLHVHVRVRAVPILVLIEGVGLRGRYPLKPSIFVSLLEIKGYPEYTAARSSRESHKCKYFRHK